MADDSDTPVRPGAVGAGDPPRQRPPPPTGEWIFQDRGQVYGPVAAGDVGALLARGTLTPETPVRREGEGWRALRGVPELQPAVEQWQARVRVERELRSARARARRASGARWTVVGLAVSLVVVLVAAGAGYLALRRPWERRNALLDGFEVAVTVGAARIAPGPGVAAGREIAVPPESASAGRRRPHDAGAQQAPRAGASARREGGAQARDGAGAIVAADYDPARIEAVVARSKETLAPCVREEARRSPDLAGEVPIEFAIGNDGRVVSLWIQDPRFRSGALQECLLTALRRWSFEPFAGQRPVVALSFHLSPR
jgi:hypothetical protein